MVFISNSNNNKVQNLEAGIELLLRMPEDMQETILNVIDYSYKEYQYNQLSHEEKMKYEDFMEQLTRDSDYSDRIMIG